MSPLYPPYISPTSPLYLRCISLISPLPRSAEQAVAQAVAEGLTLQPSSAGATGYKGVNVQRGQNTYGAYVRRAGKQVHLGSYVTAEEAALVYARSPLP